MRNASPPLIVAWTLSALLTNAGCSAIQSFQVSPRNICAGDPVQVRWKATGRVDLSAAPAVSGGGPKDDIGSETVTPHESTRFVLRSVGLFSQKTAEADVVVVANQVREFGGPAHCTPQDGVTLNLTLQEPQVSSALKVMSVKNMNPREIVVTKDGHAPMTIRPGEARLGWGATSAVGTWALQSPVQSHETCDDALTALYDRLTFQLGFACGE